MFNYHIPWNSAIMVQWLKLFQMLFVEIEDWYFIPYSVEGRFLSMESDVFLKFHIIKG